jgi:hypothetical protein
MTHDTTTKPPTVVLAIPKDEQRPLAPTKKHNAGTVDRYVVAIEHLIRNPGQYLRSEWTRTCRVSATLPMMMERFNIIRSDDGGRLVATIKEVTRDEAETLLQLINEYTATSRKEDGTNRRVVRRGPRVPLPKPEHVIQGPIIFRRRFFGFLITITRCAEKNSSEG